MGVAAGDKNLYTADSYTSIGWLHTEGGDLAKAREYCGKGYALKRELLGERHAQTLSAKFCYARALERSEKSEVCSKDQPLPRAASRCAACSQW